MTSAILLPYQQRWSKDPAQVKIWEKSRRIGASYGEAADSVLHAAAASGGGDVYYISYNKDMTSTFVDDCAGWAKRFNSALGTIGESAFKRDDDRDIHVFDIGFASGHHIRTFSNNPRNLRSKGRPGDRVVIDEAAFVDDLDELLKAAMAVTMWGGAVRLMSTHNGDDNPFNGIIQDCRAGRYDYPVHRTTLDDALADGLYRRICQVTRRRWTAAGEADWRDQLIRRYRPNEDEELFCIPARGGGAYLPRALLEACLPPADRAPPVLRFTGSAAFNALPEPARRAELRDWSFDHLRPVLAGLDPLRRHVVGWDFARKGDLTAAVVVAIAPDLRRVWRLVLELHNTPFAQQRQIFHTLLAHTPRLSGARGDASGNGAELAEYLVDEFPGLVTPVALTEGIYRERFPRYKANLEDRVIELARDDDVLEDHRAVRLVRGVPRLPEGKTDQDGRRHGDTAIAGLLADWAADEADAAGAPPVTAGRRLFGGPSAARWL